MASDAPDEWRTLRREVLATNPYWSYVRDAFALPDGREGTYFYVQSAGSVMVVPVLDDGRLLLVRQYRYLNRREGLEFPGGGQKPGSDALSAAQAELGEETGYTAGQWEKLGGLNPCKGVTDEWCTIFLARALTPEAAVADDPFEVTVPLAVPPEQIDALIAAGEIWCGITIAAWCLARGRL